MKLASPSSCCGASGWNSSVYWISAAGQSSSCSHMCVCACSDLWGAYISLINLISRDLANWSNVGICVLHMRLIYVKCATKGTTCPKYLFRALFVNGVPLNWENNEITFNSWEEIFHAMRPAVWRACVNFYRLKLLNPICSHFWCNTHPTAGIRSQFPEKRAIRQVGYQHRYNSSPGTKAQGPFPAKYQTASDWYEITTFLKARDPFVPG